MGCGQTFMKIVLVIINIIFFLASGLMLAFGITGKANPDLMAKVFTYILPQQQQAYLNNIGVNLTQIVISNSTFMIIVGVVGLVISLFGFIGACCMVRWMLVAYAIVLIILLLAEVALIIFAAVYSDSFKSVFQQAMYKSLTDEFHNEIVFYNNTAFLLPTGAVELAWAAIQLKDKCCGAYNYTDYSHLTNWNRTLSSQYSNVSVPITCCALSSGISVSDVTQIGSPSNFLGLNQCLAGNSAYINNQNCFDAVKNDISSFIQNYKGIAIGIAAGICGLELILIIFTFCLCAHHDKDGKYV
jgi:tetraspanin-18